MGYDVARDIHSDVTMSNDVAMCTYHGIQRTHEISLHKHNSCGLSRLIKHSLVLVILHDVAITNMLNVAMMTNACMLHDVAMTNVLIIPMTSMLHDVAMTNMLIVAMTSILHDMAMTNMLIIAMTSMLHDVAITNMLIVSMANILNVDMIMMTNMLHMFECETPNYL